jgi:hypothetical protein
MKTLAADDQQHLQRHCSNHHRQVAHVKWRPLASAMTTRTMMVIVTEISRRYHPNHLRAEMVAHYSWHSQQNCWDHPVELRDQRQRLHRLRQHLHQYLHHHRYQQLQRRRRQQQQQPFPSKHQQTRCPGRHALVLRDNQVSQQHGQTHLLKGTAITITNIVIAATKRTLRALVQLALALL